MSNTRTGAYVICGTPRTGSTLLCALLESTGVAGRPESYFRSQDLDMWAATWGIPRAPDGSFTFADYLRGAITVGSTANGVFAVRIMWGTMAEVADNLRDLYDDHTSSDVELLTRAWGPTQFMYLRRENVVAQAVSRARAEQTNVWHNTGDGSAMEPTHEPRYDFAQIHGYVQEIDAHNQAWADWFRTNGVQPHSVWYEDVASAPVNTARAILDFLHLEVPPHVTMSASNRRLADNISNEWITQYQAEQKARSSS